jgi:hypothetical protein
LLVDVSPPDFGLENLGTFNIPHAACPRTKRGVKNEIHRIGWGIPGEE